MQQLTKIDNIFLSASIDSKFAFQLNIFRKEHGSFDKSKVRIGLRKIAQQSFCFKINILAEKPQMITVGKYLIEKCACLVTFPYFVQCLNQPKRANGK